MAIHGLDELIAGVPAFAELDEAQLAVIAGCASNAGFAAGEQVFKEGAPADTFYVVRHGRIAMELYMPGRGELAVASVGDGELIGWSWLFPPYRWHLDARAVTDTRVVAFDGACLRGKCDENHELGYRLMKSFAAVMVERLQATRVQLLDLYGRDGPG